MSGVAPYLGAELAQNLNVSRMMGQALTVFRYRDQFEEAFGLAHQARDIVKVENRRFVALNCAKTREERFRVHCDAHEFLDQLPSKEILVGAFHEVKRAWLTEPTEQERALLVGKMLDTMMINPDAAVDYGCALGWKLGDCPKQPTERLFHRRKPWMPIPAIAGAIDHLVGTYRPAYGKPPPIPDVLEECGRHNDHLIQLHDQIKNLGCTQHLIAKIVKATDDSYPKDDWD